MNRMNIAEFREFLRRARGQSAHVFSSEGKAAQQAIEYLGEVLDAELCREANRRESLMLDRSDPVERDAARYRWLRDKNRAIVGSPLWVADSEYYAYVGEDLDRAVDSAMEDEE